MYPFNRFFFNIYTNLFSILKDNGSISGYFIELFIKFCECIITGTETILNSGDSLRCVCVVPSVKSLVYIFPALSINVPLYRFSLSTIV